MSEIADYEAQLVAKNARISQLVAALDTHHGSPCEQIRHEEELVSKNAKLAELQLRNTSLRIERNELCAQLAVMRDALAKRDGLLNWCAPRLKLAAYRKRLAEYRVDQATPDHTPIMQSAESAALTEVGK